MRFVIAVCVVLALLTAGCAGLGSETSGSGHPFSLTYDVLQGREGRSVGRMTWTGDGQPLPVLTGDGTFHDAHALRLVAELTDMRVEASFLASTSTGADLVILNQCGTPPACTKAQVEWNDRLSFGSAFGAFALHHMTLGDDGTATLRLGDLSRTFQAERLPDGLMRLRPQDAERLTGGLCNVVDDETVVDFGKGVVTTCWVRDVEETRYQLVADAGARPAFQVGASTAAATFKPLFPLETRTSLLPPGADWKARPSQFSLAEAHAAAVEHSQGLRAFLERHAEAGLEEAALEKGSSNSNGVLSSEDETYLLRYVASGEGYFVRITRTVTDNRVVPTSYRLEEDTRWTPPPHHQWAKMDPPAKRMAGIQRVMTALPDVSTLWKPTSFTLHNDATRSDARPVYRYYLVLGDTCDQDSPVCLAPDYATVDAASGRLLAGSFTGANVDALFHAPS